MFQSALFSVFTVFGGCCSNVLTLESIVSTHELPIGNTLTLFQFLLVTIEGLYSFGDFKRGFPFLKPMQIPLKVYVVSVLLFFVSSITNNSVFNYGISVPLHIVFRSSGIVITMLMSWLFNNKRYSRLQVFSGLLLTIGTIITSVFQDGNVSCGNRQPFSDLKRDQMVFRLKFLKGIALLTLSSVSSSSLSIYTERAYQKYGKHWRENLFYTHALSLPLFLIQYRQLLKQLFVLKESDKKTILTIYNVPLTLDKKRLLLANIFSQRVCIKGVNILASKTNALTLSVVLLIRKFLSLLLSLYIFSSELSLTSYVGIALVFTGALVYAIAPNIESSNATHKKEN
ncbi:hypothetical protein HG535_0F02700 [Zygotorulaspora mrakii]|uniref:Sugar phosphate transporter domain-containing protein n=1 Tax=Zygotorulaspora mrakii TaxID=42260 RepID=A0A7H9B732_ZYGMR|nr:uncharacterized protein HG535_0F02700 [Zygotorulaspora mrakii]QLG73759.1 hypothetical protein HG535_0F02700 [Zygotorulaspora mrakii]